MSDKVLAHIEAVTNQVVRYFVPYETARQVEYQCVSRDKTSEFEPDLERAKKNAEARLKSGVDQRLWGAYACYKAGKQLECLRHILLALGTICHALSWDKASAYLGEQNRVLFEMSKDEREAE